MKQAFLQKKPFILNSREKVLQMSTTGMLKQFGRNLILRQWSQYNLYNLSDDLLLADVFENFRNICIILDGISVHQVLPGMLY